MNLVIGKSVIPFRPQPTLEFRDPMELANESARTAVVDFAIAVQAAKNDDEAIAIRRQIAARVLELQAVETMALTKFDS